MPLCLREAIFVDDLRASTQGKGAQRHANTDGVSLHTVPSLHLPTGRVRGRTIPISPSPTPAPGCRPVLWHACDGCKQCEHGSCGWTRCTAVGREARTFICLKMVDLPLSPAPSRSIFTGCARSKRGVRYRADGKCSVRLLRGMVRLKSKAAAARVCILQTRRLPLPIHLPGSRVRHNQQRIRSG